MPSTACHRPHAPHGPLTLMVSDGASTQPKVRHMTPYGHMCMHGTWHVSFYRMEWNRLRPVTTRRMSAACVRHMAWRLLPHGVAGRRSELLRTWPQPQPSATALSHSPQPQPSALSLRLQPSPHPQASAHSSAHASAHASTSILSPTVRSGRRCLSSGRGPPPCLSHQRACRTRTCRREQRRQALA